MAKKVNLNILVVEWLFSPSVGSLGFRGQAWIPPLFCYLYLIRHGFHLYLYSYLYLIRHGSHMEGVDEFYQDNTVEVGWRINLNEAFFSNPNLQSTLIILFPECWNLPVLVDNGRLLHHQRKPWRIILLSCYVSIILNNHQLSTIINRSVGG